MSVVGDIETEIWSVNPGQVGCFHGVELLEWVSPNEYVLLDMFVDTGVGDHQIFFRKDEERVPDNWIMA